MASTTFIDGQTVIYASWLNDVNTAVYNGTFPNGSISLTNLNVSGSVTGAGFTSVVNSNLLTPGPIGSVTPNTGKFTSLQATSLTGLTTPLAASFGGTGLASSGAANNILASNGTTWTSKPLLDYFGYSNGTSGYQRFPGGMTIQWGQYNSTITDTAGVTITLPIAYSTQFCSVTTNLIYNSTITGSSSQATYNYITSNSTFNVFVGDTGSAGNNGFTWMAIGY
jgi:hypothetical protein